MRGLHKLTPSALIGFVTTFVLLAFIISRCSEQPGSAELQRGQRIMYQVMGDETLQKAGFYEAYPGGGPAEFADFASSEQGRILWPMTIGEHKASAMGRAGRSPDRLLRPEALSFSGRTPDSDAGEQIVYVPLDDEGQMEIRGYETPDSEPVFVYQWDFPTDAGEVPLHR
jgi:hypothetical protein